MTSRTVTIAAYLVVVALAIVAELAARQRRGGLVPLERLLRRLRAATAGQVLLLLGWAWLSWHLLAR